MGINPKPAAASDQSLSKLTSPLTTSQVKVKQLMEQTICKMVLVNSEGTVMWLAYYAPALRKAAPALATASNTRPGQPYAAH